MDRQFYSSTELAKILGVSRVTIFNRIKRGEIKATKVGRNFVIDSDDINFGIGARAVQEEDKQSLARAVKKVVADYGETLRLLGSE